MPLENLMIGRVCLHEVHRRSDDRALVSPTYANGLLDLPGRAREVFASRVHGAFRSGAQCMGMNVRHFGPGTVLALGSTIVNATDRDFVSHSREFADLLAEAQASRQIPGGICVVFDGTVGYPSTPFFAVMKAELHDGFLKTSDLQAEFVDSLFLSPKTKLYKIGMFVSDGHDPRPNLPHGWLATVYDSQMTKAQRDSAALYFHERFLGLQIPEDSAHQVKQFFHKTRDYIKATNLDEEAKVDLYNGLYTYLKVDREPTIGVDQFAERFMPEDLLDNYRNYMRREKFPGGAIEKDLSEIEGLLKLRRFRFPRRIMLSGPPDALADLVTVTPIEEPEGTALWTQITIRGRLEAQE